MRPRFARPLAAFAAAVLAAAGLVTGPRPADAAPRPAPTYRNPVSAPAADTFADPAVIRGRDGFWYAFGTSDPLRAGETEHRLLPIMRSTDLVNWTYMGDAFTSRPAWATPTAGLWAPDIRYTAGRYVLYFTVTDTTLNPGDDSAIGVATAPTPLGPWTATDRPVVGPRPAPNGGFLWTFDPAQLVDADGRLWLYYGSYFGGIYTVPLAPDGLSVAGTPTQVTIDNRYEGAYVVRRGPWYYLFASAANCCAGPTTGYSVFAGRSRSPAGPFVDRDGVSLLTSRVGGTPVIQPNGNRWIGTGHNAVVTDLAGQDWFVYHAIDRNVPYLNEPFGINRRPMLIDRLDWRGGWPTVRNGRWASDTPQRAPVTSGHHGGGGDAGPPAQDPRANRLVRAASDEFSGSALGSGWTWIRADPDATVTDGALRWPTQAADLVGPGNTAAVLVRDAPAGDYIVEIKLSIDLGVDTVRNFQQAGLIVYRGDDDFARLSHVAIWNTRQIEFGREIPYATGLSYGGMVEGPPADTTWLRLAHTTVGGEHRFRAGWSTDGRHWTWGGVWTFAPGAAPRIGLISHGGDDPQATALFDYFRVYR